MIFRLLFALGFLLTPTTLFLVSASSSEEDLRELYVFDKFVDQSMKLRIASNTSLFHAKSVFLAGQSNFELVILPRDRRSPKLTILLEDLHTEGSIYLVLNDVTNSGDSSFNLSFANITVHSCMAGQFVFGQHTAGNYALEFADGSFSVERNHFTFARILYVLAGALNILAPRSSFSFTENTTPSSGSFHFCLSKSFLNVRLLNSTIFFERNIFGDKGPNIVGIGVATGYSKLLMEMSSTSLEMTSNEITGSGSLQFGVADLNSITRIHGSSMRISVVENKIDKEIFWGNSLRSSEYLEVTMENSTVDILKNTAEGLIFGALSEVPSVSYLVISFPGIHGKLELLDNSFSRDFQFCPSSSVENDTSSSTLVTVNSPNASVEVAPRCIYETSSEAKLVGHIDRLRILTPAPLTPAPPTPALTTLTTTRTLSKSLSLVSQSTRISESHSVATSSSESTLAESSHVSQISFLPSSSVSSDQREVILVKETLVSPSIQQESGSSFYLVLFYVVLSVLSFLTVAVCIYCCMIKRPCQSREESNTPQNDFEMESHPPRVYDITSASNSIPTAPSLDDTAVFSPPSPKPFSSATSYEGVDQLLQDNVEMSRKINALEREKRDLQQQLANHQPFETLSTGRSPNDPADEICGPSPQSSPQGITP